MHLIQASQRGKLDTVPTSVQSLVSASLATLTKRDRTAVEAAAVLGQQFQIDGLRV